MRLQERRKTVRRLLPVSLGETPSDALLRFERHPLLRRWTTRPGTLELARADLICSGVREQDAWGWQWLLFNSA